MSRKPLTTFEDFAEARQYFDQIPTVHVSDASSYLALLQCNLVEDPIYPYMGGLGHFEVSLTWGIPSPSYIKLARSHTTAVQMLPMEGQSLCPMFTTRQQSGSTTT